MRWQLAFLGCWFIASRASFDSSALRNQSCSSLVLSPSRDESPHKLTKIWTTIDAENPLRTNPCIQFPYCFDVPDASRISHTEVCRTADIVRTLQRFVFRLP